jgi:hypothetical protein
VGFDGVIRLGCGERAQYPRKKPAIYRQHRRQETKLVQNASLPLLGQFPDDGTDDGLGGVALILCEPQPAQVQPEASLQQPEAAAVVVDDPPEYRIVIESAGEDGGKAAELVRLRLADCGGLVRGSSDVGHGSPRSSASELPAPQRPGQRPAANRF